MGIFVLNGALAERYAYSPFGQVNAPSHPAIGNPYLFAGREFDSETGLYYSRARYYDPDMGRFLSTDPLGYADGMNLYAYVRNNPINRVDPLGLFGSDDPGRTRARANQNVDPAMRAARLNQADRVSQGLGVGGIALGAASLLFPPGGVAATALTGGALILGTTGSVTGIATDVSQGQLDLGTAGNVISGLGGAIPGPPGVAVSGGGTFFGILNTFSTQHSPTSVRMQVRARELGRQ